MALTGTWTFDYANKVITRSGGSGVDTVLDLYSFIGDTFDEVSQMDDPVPMSAQTPTAFSLINGWTIEANSYQYLKGGAITDTTNNDLWANLYTLGTIVAGTQIYLDQNGTIVFPWWGTGHIDILVKVKSGGSLVDSGLVRLLAREWGNAFDNFQIDLSGGGRNPVPLATNLDLNNTTGSGTVATWTDITATFGATSKDLNNGNGAKNYSVVVDCNGRPLSQVYEYLKYLTRRGNTNLLNGVHGQRYLSAHGSYTESKPAPLGTFAGGKFFGAQGVWLDNVSATDLKSFELTANDGTVQVPPNTVYVSVAGLVAGDRISVFRLSAPGGSIAKDEMQTSGTNNQGSNALNVNAIGTDVPSSGFVRIHIDENTEYLHTYSARTSAAFTGLSPALANNVSAGVDVFAPFIDKVAASSIESNSLIQSSEIPVVTRVRKKGILPFEVSGIIGSTGLVVTAVRTLDNVVQ